MAQPPNRYREYLLMAADFDKTYKGFTGAQENAKKEKKEVDWDVINEKLKDIDDVFAERNSLILKIHQSEYSKKKASGEDTDKDFEEVKPHYDSLAEQMLKLQVIYKACTEMLEK